DAQLSDDAAGRMLDLLDARIDDEESGCDHRARELGGRGPAAHPAADQQHHHHAGGEMAADRALRRIVSLAHRAPAPSVTIWGGMAVGGAGRRPLLSPSSLGPKAWQRPSPIISTWSTPASALGLWATTTTMPPRRRTPRIAWLSASSPSASRLELGS